MNKKFRTGCIVAAVVMMLTVGFDVSYGETTAPEDESVAITAIDVEEIEKEMFVGDTQILNVTTYPAEADTSKITYESSDPSVLSVSPAGKVTAEKKGDADITIRGDQAEKTIAITVREKTEKIELNTAYLTLKTGDSYVIEAKAYPKKSSQQFSFSSTNKNVAVVDQTGCITAMNEGHCSITVTNEVLIESVFVIVNQTPETIFIESALEEASPLTKKKEKSKISKSSLTPQNLKKLAKDARSMTLSYGVYKVTVEGEKIKNPEHTLNTEITFEEKDNGLQFLVNEGNPLPGSFQLTLGEPYREYTYLYLYNEEKEKYQRLQYDSSTGEINISTSGIYFLTDEKQEYSVFPEWVLWSAGIIILLLVTGYIAIKRRYWFW